MTRHDATFFVSKLGWDLKTDPRQQGKGEIADFRLFYFPGQYSPAEPGTTHQQLDTCGSPPGAPQTVAIFNWWSIYAVDIGTNPSFFNTTDGWFVSDWTVYNDGAAVLARKTVDVPHDASDIHMTAPTHFVLNHTPGP